MQNPTEPILPAEYGLTGGGEMGRLVRSMNWAQTPLGPIEAWPQSLRTTVSLLLSSRHPMFLFWGPEAVCLYNDGYRPSLGMHKHPQALGQRGHECWAEIWDIIGPQIEGVMTRAEETWHEDQLVPFDRNGYFEEIYFTYSYSPVRDESGGVGGTLVVCSETTERVLGERRLRTLRDLAALGTETRDVDTAIRAICETLSANAADIPFALVYEVDKTRRQAQLACAAGLSDRQSDGCHHVELPGNAAASTSWPLHCVAATGVATVVENLDQWPAPLPGGAWPEVPRQALVLPLTLPGQPLPERLLVAGVSPRRALDAQYRTFFDLTASQIVSVIANATAYEEEHQRAEALAEIDRVKTEFFRNVSHEFRTPLTLILGPLEEALFNPTPLPAAYREPLDTAYGNALRLLKLVNTLLDFSRLEASRTRAVYEPTDLAKLTSELVSQFSSVTKRADLELVVACPPLPKPVYVDPDMWEKIVLNLMSNAIKFTFEGYIKVALSWADDHIEFKVKDTGVGIPAPELPHIFERFHRVRNTLSRSHEGTGIGLALTQKLVHLHGGDIQVSSRVGHGTEFTVCLPTGSVHCPTESIGAMRSVDAAAPTSHAFVEEALRWLDDDVSEVSSSAALLSQAATASRFEPERTAPELLHGPRQRVLLADDNADMRAYIARLLRPHYEVVAVADGQQALAAVRTQPPDLVLTDIMMPGLDGLELLQALRADPHTRTLPIILLTARAGEEPQNEGLETGADDYLVKPFAARELLARVKTHLNLSRMRQETEAALRSLTETLEQRVAAQTAELSCANAALQAEVVQHLEAREQLERQQEALAQREKLAAMGSLLASVAHELNNPLTAVMTQADLLGEELGPHPLREQATEIIQAAERCVGIVRNFLTLAHQHAPQRTRVEFNHLVSEAMKLMSYPLQVDTIDVRQHLADDLPPLWADPNQLHQVIVNLLTNAHQALRETAGPRHLTLRTRIEPHPQRVLFEVADTGPGISPEVQARMFEPFFTTKPTGVGTGLGLPFCQGIVEEHGGTLGVVSQPGQGTVLRVELPVQAIPPSVETAAAPDEGSHANAGKAILIVDDEEGIRRSLARLLRRDGYEVETASNGREALEKCRAQPFDLILSDLRMPELDGPGFYRELVRHAPSLGQRFLFLTGDTLSPEVDVFLADIAAPRLTKPFTATAARRAIYQALARRSPSD